MTDFELAAHGNTYPCSQNPGVDCGTNIPPASGFNPLAYDPNGPKDANGCFSFQGCFVVTNGRYLAWVSPAVGYVPVGPAPEPSPAQQYQLLNPPEQNPAQQYQLLNPAPQVPQATFSEPTVTVNVLDQNGARVAAQVQVPASVAQAGTTISAAQYASILQTHATSVQHPSPAQLYNMLNPPPPSPAAQYQLLNPPPVNVQVNTQPIADALDRYIASNQALLARAQPPVNNVVNVDTTPIAAEVDRFIAEGQAAQQEQTKLFADGFGQLATSQAEQVDVGKAQVGSLDHIQTLLSAFNDILSGKQTNLLGDLFKGSFNDLGDEVIARLKIYKAIFDKMLAGEYKTWDELQADLSQVSSLNDITFLAIDVMGVLSVFLRLGVLRMEPIATELSQLAQAQNPLKVLDPGTLQEVYRRGEWSAQDTSQELAKQGIDQTRADLIMKVSRQLLDPVQNELGYLRGFIDAPTSSENLQKLGYSAEDASVLAQLMQKIPPPSDLTRIADKRVWGLQTDPRYGQYAELPDEYLEFMKQWGYDEKFTGYLWAAHWQLPSIQALFDGWHRQKITNDDIDAALGLTDWLPFFRDMLKELSYNLMTRVDIRRAHNAGLLSDDQAAQRYAWLGYTPDDVQILVALSKETGTEQDPHIIQQIRDRARTKVEEAYVKGTISAQEAENHLLALGVDAATAQTLISLLDHEISASGATTRHAAHTTKAIDTIIGAFAKGSVPYDDALSMLQQLQLSRDDAINELLYAEMDRLAELKGEWAKHAITLYAERTIEYPDFSTLLGEHGFSGTEIAQLAQEAEMKRQQRQKKPTEAQLHGFLKKGIIDLPAFETEMRGLGYPDQYIGWFAKS